MTLESERVVLGRDVGGVRILTLNRPDRNNAWTIEMEERYFGALIAASADPGVRAVLVTGAGRSFCPGLDAEALSSVSAGGQISEHGRIRQTLPLSIPKPIVAAINGACAGIGLVQALMCDVRFCARSARLSTAFSRRGLPAENGVAWLLARLVGQGTAADLLLSGRVVSADEALELGLVNRVVDPDELLPAARAYCDDLARLCSPRAMADIKRQLYGSLETGLEDARLGAKRVFEAARNHADFEEGVLSFVERRPPRFDGLQLALDVAEFRDGNPAETALAGEGRKRG